MDEILTATECDEYDLVEAEIDLKKIYNFPNEIAIRKHNDVFLVIYTEGIMWLVLENENELAIFNSLNQGLSIENVLEQYDEDLVIKVVTQIEAKRFYAPIKNENNEKNIYIYLTNKCNQCCRHCYMYAGEIIIEELSPEEWIKVLQEFKDNGGHGVTFTGGEPMVYRGFDKVIKYAHEIGLAVTVLSNGILWTKEQIESLHEYIDEIQISLDGYDKDSYYSVRQYDGFDKAVECIEHFYNVGTKVSMAVTPLYDNIELFIEKFEGFAKTFMAKYPDVFIKINLELIAGRMVKTTTEENEIYRSKLKQLVLRLYPEYYTETFVLNYENRILRKGCGFGEITFAPNGDVFWCNRIHELKKATNVLEVGFKRIMEISEKIKESISVDNTVECKECDIKYICGGGCRMNYSGIKEVDSHIGEWNYTCQEKKNIYDKMILSNEYFYV